jgi:hypothetical protein
VSLHFNSFKISFYLRACNEVANAWALSVVESGSCNPKPYGRAMLLILYMTISFTLLYKQNSFALLICFSLLLRLPDIIQQQFKQRTDIILHLLAQFHPFHFSVRSSNIRQPLELLILYTLPQSCYT